MRKSLIQINSSPTHAVLYDNIRTRQGHERAHDDDHKGLATNVTNNKTKSGEINLVSFRWINSLVTRQFGLKNILGHSDTRRTQSHKQNSL